MKVAFVLSDAVFPPREGLHAQSWELLRALQATGTEITLFAFVKDVRTVNETALFESLGLRFAAPPVQYSGGSIIQGLTARFGFGTQVRQLRGRLDQLEVGSVLHLEGAAACGLFRWRSRLPTVLSWIDPGMRRNLRFALAERSMGKTIRYTLAAVAFLCLEVSVRSPRAIWHVVSDADQRFLHRVHPHQQTISIPTITEPIVRFSDSLVMSSMLLRVVVFADLRQSHLERSVARFAELVQSVSGQQARFELVFLGRVRSNSAVDIWTASLSYSYVDWVDDIEGFLGTADIVVLPDDVGTGLKNRALLSMALGLTVLATPVAMEGIEIEPGRDALVRPLGPDFVRDLDELVLDEGRRRALGKNASRVVRSQDRIAIARFWSSVYRDLQNVEVGSRFDQGFRRRSPLRSSRQLGGNDRRV